MSDYTNITTRVALDSDIVRVLPNALVQVFQSGTATLVTEVTSDASGIYQVATLASGKYDIKVNGILVDTVNLVKFDHTHKSDQMWTFRHSGAITVDNDEDQNHEAHGSSVAGTITNICLTVERATNTGNVTIHLLRGAADGASVLTFAANSVWSQQVNPGGGATHYRLVYENTNPNIAISANQVLCLGIDYIAAGVEGVVLRATFRPS